MNLDVGPGDVAHETLSADPGLQACSVQAAIDSDSVEVDVGDIDEFRLTFAE